VVVAIGVELVEGTEADAVVDALGSAVGVDDVLLPPQPAASSVTTKNWANTPRIATDLHAHRAPKPTRGEEANVTPSAPETGHCAVLDIRGVATASDSLVPGSASVTSLEGSDRRRWSAAGAGDEGGDDVGGVPVE
jgi:hypothetical protein